MQDYQEEIWLNIANIPYYQVSNLGRVKSLSRTIIRADGKSLPVSEKLLVLNNLGYYRVLLSPPSGKKMALVHRLVALAFLPNPNNYKIVNHINGNKLDNRVENLEWCTYSQNAIHALSTGLRKSGQDHHCSKLSQEQVTEVRDLKSKGSTLKQLGTRFEIHYSGISRIVNHKKWIYGLLLVLFTIDISGQTPGSSPVSKDTKRCYDTTELRAIALALISGAECDTTLKIAKNIMDAQASAIESQKKTIDKQDIRYLETEHAVDECEVDKTALKKDLKKAKLKLTWTKVGWAATAVAEAVLVIYFMIKP